MKSDFSVAVHALVYLSVKGCTLSSDALADNICTNAARVRKVMARLKKAGLVGAREGSEGGFCPQVPPAELTLDRVAAAVDRLCGVRLAQRRRRPQLRHLCRHGRRDG